MTVVVWSSKEKMLASDSRMLENSESGGDRAFLCRKLYHITRPPNGGMNYERHLYVGLAGDQSGLKFLRWVREGMDFKSKPEFAKADDFSALVVEVMNFQIRDVSVYGVHCEPEPVVEEYHAIGSGSKHAFTAMDLGQMARVAVEMAILRDPNCGGPIKLMPCSG